MSTPVENGNGSTGMNPEDAAKLIYTKLEELCSEFSQGVPDIKLQESLPTLDVSARTLGINKLLAQGKLELLQKNKTLFYKLKDASVIAQGGDPEEKVVYQIVEQHGNKGVWIREIRNKCNLPVNTLNKILKSLESKKLIKAVPAVKAGRKKVYMLTGLEPDTGLTGGAWYSDQEFEVEFVEILNRQCLKFLQLRSESARSRGGSVLEIKRMSLVSTQEIWKYIKDLGISKVALTEDDIEMILRTLIYDRKVEETTTNRSDGSVGNLYRVVNSLMPPGGLLTLPCGLCPVSDYCGEQGAVTPLKCTYLKDWLE